MDRLERRGFGPYIRGNNQSPAPRPAPRRPVDPIVEGQCNALGRHGRRCKRDRLEADGRCYLHRGMTVVP